MFPGNRSDTARLLLGECPDASSDVGRMLRGNCADTDWPRTGHGLDAAAAIVPDIRQHGLGRYPSIAQDTSPDAARMIRRMIRRTSYQMLRGHCAICCLTFK